jgi:lipoate-protein ligase A
MSTALPTFGFVTVHADALADGMAQESAWLEQAAAGGRAAAHLWRGARSLVVPRRYERLPLWAEACAQSAAEGWPVRLRASGGGLVPQASGVWNLSLVWRAAGAAPADTESLYLELAAELSAALARLGIAARPQAVQGSFCDGRFNLAVNGRKCIGTAQAWRRISGQPAVLLHAVILVSADPDLLTGAANRLESLAGSCARYRADVLVSLAQAWSAAHGGDAPPPDFDQQLVHVLAERFARIVPPRAQPCAAAAQPAAAQDLS